MLPTLMTRSIFRTLASMAAWALVHSALATKSSKHLAARAWGEQRRNGLYRIAYNTIAVVSTTGLVLYIHSFPDKKLYAVRGKGRAALRIGQLCLLGVLFAAAVEIGIGPFSGFSELLAYALHRKSEDAPEAQGPSLGASGLKTGGPYRFVRHPLNFCATAIVFLAPDMTVVRLTVATVTLLYSLGGSKLEERRLLQTYGEPYKRYLMSDVPFFFPSLKPLSSSRIS